MRRVSWRIVMGAESRTAMSSTPSKPTSDKSPGMDSPISKTARIAPSAIASPSAKTAVRSGERMMSLTIAS